MKPTKVTWIGFLLTLSALAIPTKTIAHNHNSVSESESQSIESRLSKIAKTLKERESKFKGDSDTPENLDFPENTDIAGWIKGYRGGFVNGYRGGFLNRRGWRDGGGFFNRRYY